MTKFSEQQYQEFKRVALNSEPLTFATSINEVEIIDGQTISVKGKRIQASEEFQSRLVEMIGIPTRFLSEYARLMPGDVPSFVNFLKTVKGAHENKSIVLLANDNKVFGVQEHYMPREIFFKTFEDIMNEREFEINQMYAGNGSIHIQTIMPNSQFNVGNDPEEFFQAGFSLDSNKNGMNLGSYIYRLVCTNGMIGKSSEEILKYEDPGKFWEGLGYLMRHNFISKTFREQVTTAKNTLASIAEVEYGRDLIRSCNSAEIDPLVLERFVPFGETKALLERNKLDIYKLDKSKKKNITADCTVWDVVNGITDFASHDYRINVNESARLNLQVQAGNMLNKKSFDTQNLIILKR